MRGQGKKNQRERACGADFVTVSVDNRKETDATSRNQDRQHGAITAEFAMVLPALAILAAVVGGVGVVGTAQVRVQHAAGVAARDAARGAEAPIESLAGSGSRSAVSREGEWVTVKVDQPVALWKFMGPNITVTATATARQEEIRGGTP